MSLSVQPSLTAKRQASAAKQRGAQQILFSSQSNRDIIQDFVPLAESLEWMLGQHYFRDRGNKAFLSDAIPVPFIINNDGILSASAAQVFFTSLMEAEASGQLEPHVFVLELGMGVGLFARFFLDDLRDLCRQYNKDFYDRLTYIAGDYSERMLTDILRNGILNNHLGHYRVRVVDAMHGDEELPHDLVFLDHPYPDTPFRAVFLSYVLDCLPVASLEIDCDEVKQLCVRTCLARNVPLADYTDMSLGQLQERGKSKDPQARQELLEVYGLFASEYDYRPVDIKQFPYGEFAFEYARKKTKRLLFSYGAMQSLEKLLSMVHDQGFILINDYGQTQVTGDEEFEHQRFSLATAVGLNFPLLKAYFADSGKCEWIEPFGQENRGIYSRLLSRKLPPEVRRKFQEVFGQVAHEKVQQPLKRARECVEVGRFEMAAGLYNQALQLQPRNWVLLNEISTFLTFQLRDPKAGIDMAKLALALNPTCSADLWCTLGDGLYEFGRTAEARSAYLKALEVNESDVRARFNLAWVHTREKNYPAALAMIAQALALDKTGAYRDRLLQKQQEVLAHLTARNQQEYLLLINLVSKYAKKDDKPKEEPEKGE